MSGDYNCKGRKHSLGWYLFKNSTENSLKDFFDSMPVLSFSIVTEKVNLNLSNFNRVKQKS